MIFVLSNVSHVKLVLLYELNLIIHKNHVKNLYGDMQGTCIGVSGGNFLFRTAQNSPESFPPVITPSV